MNATSRLVPMSVAVACLSACAGVDFSSEANDPIIEANTFVSSFASIGLSIGTTAFFTEGEVATGQSLGERREIALAIARGSGPFVTDLAQWLELPPALLPDLGVALRDARPVLHQALSSPLTVKAFESLLGVALCRHPRIRYHAWRRFPCEQLAPLHALLVPPESLAPEAAPE